MQLEISIRKYCADDCEHIVRLFRETVHAVNAIDYTKGQLDAWAPEKIDRDKWANTLASNFTVVTERDGMIIGFGDIDAAGYFDHLFVHKDFQGQGIASVIANAIEAHARKMGMARITVAASITAKSFFEKRDYKVIKEQHVERNGQVLKNFLMECFI